MRFERRSGILLHPTSLPGRFGIGDIGPACLQWLDFLADSGQRLWQVLPLGPTGYGDSPYQCFSAFAGNPYLLSPEVLLEEGFLSEDDLASYPEVSASYVDFGAVIPAKIALLERAYERFQQYASQKQRASYASFCQADWLEDYALFMACKEVHEGQAWSAWEPGLRDRDTQVLEAFRAEHAQMIEKFKVWQWFFDTQWQLVKSYAAKKDIQIIGDIPIFIAYDSADAWANPEVFFFDEKGQPEVVAGVPPDYFSKTGQRWGNPLYRWDKMQARGYSWWIKRVEATLKLVDIVRIDHFRGFEAYWEIPASEATAVKGRWVKGPNQTLFDAFDAAFDDLPIIAEDLGVITPEVELLRDENNFPGMKVLQFAFASDATDPYLPHNYTANSVVYSGTHDNDTTLGWYQQASEEERDFIRRYLGRDDRNIVWDVIRLAFSSVAVMAVVPMQDVLNLDASARMNTPGKDAGNWSWRFTEEQLEDWIAPQLKNLAVCYGRSKLGKKKDTAYRQSSLDDDIATDASPTEVDGQDLDA